jgi:hypothetical protein
VDRVSAKWQDDQAAVLDAAGAPLLWLLVAFIAVASIVLAAGLL